jgi:hypothetical protein
LKYLSTILNLEDISVRTGMYIVPQETGAVQVLDTSISLLNV